MRHALFLLLVACGGAQQPAPAPSPAPEAPADAEPEPLAGGWAPADPAADDVREASEQAQILLRERTGDETLRIWAITSARTQVVAGKNYELVVDLSGRGGEKDGVKVVLYRDLKGKWSLTSVEGL